MITARETKLRRRYLDLCRNPLRGDKQVSREFDELINHPRVVGINMLKTEVLMVGTDPIIITDRRREYEIGEFIIYLIRKPTGQGYWETDFRFWNVTGSIYPDGEIRSHDKVVYVHPHITPMRDKKYPFPNGKICIERGQFDVYQYIRLGQMHWAVDRLFEILETHTSGGAYLDPCNWPRRKRK